MICQLFDRESEAQKLWFYTKTNAIKANKRMIVYHKNNKYNRIWLQRVL